MSDSKTLPTTSHDTARSELVEFSGTDLGVRITLESGDLTVEVMKADSLVYRVVVEQATGALENAWIVDLFMRSDRVRLADISAEVTEYLGSLNIAQG